MATEVANALGTQKQFRKQPQGTYSAKLKQPSFGGSLSAGKDLNAATLANSLGVLGDAIWKEKVANEEREMNQLTLDQAMKAVAGKTEEDLKKFDTLKWLQHNDTGYDLSDNKYTKAILARAMGIQAATLAKQQYMTESEGVVPKSVEDAVTSYTKLFTGLLDKYKGNVDNEMAFNAGVNDTFYKDTLTIAENARQAINNDKREAGKRCFATLFGDMLTNCNDNAVFAEKMTELTNSVQLIFKNPTEAAQYYQQLFKEYDDLLTVDKLEIIKDMKFFDDRTFGAEILKPNAYQKAVDRELKKKAKEINDACKREDGTVDSTKRDKMLKDLLGGTETTSRIPQGTVNVGDKQEAVDKLYPGLKDALPSVFGLLEADGYTDAVISSAYREAGQAGNAGSNSYHTKGMAVDIDLGQGRLTREQGDALAEKFKPYFSEVLWEMEGDPTGATGDHLHLAGYKGGLEPETVVKEEWIKGLSYVPDAEDRLRKYSESHQIDNDNAIKEQWLQNERQLDVAIYKATSNDEIRSLIEEAEIPDWKKVEKYEALEKSIEKQKERAKKEAEGRLSLVDKRMLAYEKEQLVKDKQKLAYYYQIENGYTDASGNRVEGRLLSNDEKEKKVELQFRYFGYLSYINPDEWNGYGGFGWYNGVNINEPTATTVSKNSVGEFKKLTTGNDLSQGFTLQAIKNVYQKKLGQGESQEQVLNDVKEFCDKHSLNFEEVKAHILSGG